MTATAANADARRIEALLERHLPAPGRVTVSAIAPVFGGNARRAVSFEARIEADGRERTIACVMLGAPPGRHVESDPAQEFAVLRALEARGTRAPRAIALDADGATVGTPSIVLERLPGTAAPVPILEGRDRAVSLGVAEALVEVAAELHAVDPAALAPEVLADPRATVARQVRHWREVSDAHRLEPLPALDSVFGWLDDHLPAPARLAIVHGDLRVGNLLYDGPRITGLLDWEMAHVGDPLEDIAWIYRPTWSIAHFLPLAQFVCRYERRTGRMVDRASLRFWRVFAEVKFACISLTAAHVFASGRTANLRLADRASLVPACLLRCFEWIEAPIDA